MTVIARLRWRWSGLVALVGALAILVGCGMESADPMEEDDPTADSSDAPLAPGFTLATLDGKKISLADYEGEVVLINFWATWCAPCREEMPVFNDLRRELRGEGFEVLAISLDDEREAIPPFVEELRLEFPILLGERNVLVDYDVALSIPKTVIVNREGRVVEVLVGAQERDVLEPLIRKYL